VHVIIDLYLEYVVYAQEYKVINMSMMYVFEYKCRPIYYIIFKKKERFFNSLRTHLRVSAKYNPPSGGNVILKVI
jgi:hypothetical protein